MRISVVGSGYVGLVTGACFADLGHEVVLVDNDGKKLAALRDGVSAVALAQKAVRLSGGENPRMLRTLAAAEAEAGRFVGAAETARQALQLAAVQKNDPLAATLQKELELYQMNTPMREGKP